MFDANFRKPVVNFLSPSEALVLYLKVSEL
jgi:hypothetical protein